MDEYYDTSAFKHSDTKKGWSGDRTIIGPAPEEPKRAGGKKDTKKWCKGVRGREHKWVWVYTELLWSHRPRHEKFVEPPLPPEGADIRQSPHDPQVIWFPPHASMYCPVCQKKHKHVDAFALRRKGIQVLCAVPVSE